MDRSTVIELVGSTLTQDDYGVWVQTTTTRQVFARIDSVTRAEFFEGGRNGLNPEIKFTMFFGDYDGEDTVVYNGLQYAVYRTYQGLNDIVELYCERKGGTNAQGNSG